MESTSSDSFEEVSPVDPLLVAQVSAQFGFDQTSPVPRAATAVPAAPAVGGGELISEAKTLKGESLIIVPSADVMSTLCRHKIGTSGLVCFKKEHDCSVKKKTRLEKAPGIYLMCNSNPDRVYGDPVGDLSLLNHHRNAILDFSVEGNDEKSEFILELTNWEHSSTTIEAAAVTQLKTRARSKRTHLEPNSKLDEGDKLELEVLEDLLSDCATDLEGVQDQAPVDNFTYVRGLKATCEYIKGVEKVADKNLSVIIDDISRLSVHMNATLLRLEDIEAAGALHLPSVRDKADEALSLAGLVQARVNAVAPGFKEFTTNTNEHFGEIHKQLTALKLGNSAAPSSPPTDLSQLNDLVKKVAALEEKEKHHHQEVARLRAIIGEQQTSTALEVRLSDGSVERLLSASDLQLYLKSIGALDINFGGFVDPFILLNWFSRFKEHTSLDSYVSVKEKSAKLNFTVYEIVSMMSVNVTLPVIFADKKTSDAGTVKSHIKSLATYSSWKDNSSSVFQSGLNYELQDDLPRVVEHLNKFIQDSYWQYPALLEIAQDNLKTSARFIEAIRIWVNQEYEKLKAANLRPGASAVQTKAHEEDIWILITGIIVHLFEDNLAPLRFCSAINKREEASSLIWITIACSKRCKHIIKAGIAKDPVVTSQMAEWMVRHSGKADATSALDKVDKLSSLVNDISADLKKAQATAKKAEATTGSLSVKVDQLKKKM